MARKRDLHLDAFVAALTTAVHASTHSRRSLDEAFGWSPGTVSKILTGTIELKVHHLLQICPAIGIHPGEVFYVAEMNFRSRGTLGTVEQFARMRKEFESRQAAFKALDQGELPSETGEGGKVLREELRAMLREEIATLRNDLGIVTAGGRKTRRKKGSKS